MPPVNNGDRSPATIYDVAERAGVSISTVSLALNAPERVRPATLTRIMEAVDVFGYTPKAEAVARARRGTGRIGVIAPFTSSPTESGLRLSGILEAANPRGYEIAVFDQPSGAASRLMSLPVTRKVDGLIIASVPFDAEVEQRLTGNAIPACVIEIPHSGLTNVLIDHRAGGATAGTYLSGRGHQRFAYVGHRQVHDYPSQSLAKLEGYASVLPTAPEIRNVDHDFAAAVAAGRDLLDQPSPPTAVFTHDDLLASGVLVAARQLGLRVPDDVAIVGFNDTELAEPLGLTTLRQPFAESGRLAFQLLADLVNDPDTSRREVTLTASIVERDTA